MGYAEDGFDDGELLPPLPPEDRLWRHPSEVGFERSLVRHRRNRWLRLGLTGAFVLVGVVAGATMLRGNQGAELEDAAPAPTVGGEVLATVRSTEPPWSSAVSQAATPAIATLDITTASGKVAASAVVWREDGYLITDARVVADARLIEVTLSDGSTHRAGLVGTDVFTSLAVLHIDVVRVPDAPADAAAQLTIGDRVAVVVPDAYPFETSIFRTRVALTTDRSYVGLAEIAEGLDAHAAGGALVDAGGAVVGILLSVDGDMTTHAVPFELAQVIAADIVEYGSAVHPWLGISGNDVDESTDAAATDGALVVSVERSGPAHEAGLEPDDVITSINGEAVDSMDDLVALLLTFDPGSPVTLGIVRDDKTYSVSATLSAWPSD